MPPTSFSKAHDRLLSSEVCLKILYGVLVGKKGSAIELNKVVSSDWIMFSVLSDLFSWTR